MEDYLLQLHLYEGDGKLFIIVIKEHTTTLIHTGRHLLALSHSFVHLFYRE